MKIEYILLAVLIVVTVILAAMIGYAVRNTERSSSFVGYSQSCWQVGDTLHVVTAKGDTIKLDVSRLDGTLPIHTLHKFHRYTLNPMVMAVRDVVINQHDLVSVDGEVLKVVSVDAVNEGCVEIRTIRVERYNR